MNVYDFDHTIYDGDCTLDFFFYCLAKYPKAILSLPYSCLIFMAYKFHFYECENFKEVFYRFLRYIPNVEGAVKEFWNHHEHKIKDWYLAKKKKTDIVISASPEFLLEHICKQLNVKCIASKVNPMTGKLESRNCKGKEKVERFLAEYPTTKKIDKFFSDSLSDICLAQIAQDAYLVHGNMIDKWEF